MVLQGLTDCQPEVIYQIFQWQFTRCYTGYIYQILYKQLNPILNRIYLPDMIIWYTLCRYYYIIILHTIYYKGFISDIIDTDIIHAIYQILYRQPTSSLISVWWLHPTSRNMMLQNMMGLCTVLCSSAVWQAVVCSTSSTSSTMGQCATCSAG